MIMTLEALWGIVFMTSVIQIHGSEFTPDVYDKSLRHTQSAVSFNSQSKELSTTTDLPKTSVQSSHMEETTIVLSNILTTKVAKSEPTSSERVSTPQRRPWKQEFKNQNNPCSIEVFQRKIWYENSADPRVQAGNVTAECSQSDNSRGIRCTFHNLKLSSSCEIGTIEVFVDHIGRVREAGKLVILMQPNKASDCEEVRVQDMATCCSKENCKQAVGSDYCASSDTRSELRKCLDSQSGKRITVRGVSLTAFGNVSSRRADKQAAWEVPWGILVAILFGIIIGVLLLIQGYRICVKGRCAMGKMPAEEPHPLLRQLEPNLSNMIKEIMIDREGLDIQERIGHGNSGEVYRGTLKIRGSKRTVALKALKEGLETNKMELAAFLEEASIMKDFDHPNVLSLLGVVVDTEEIYVALPYMAKGSLKIMVSNIVFDLYKFMGFTLDVARGMEYLAEQNFVHRDVAARNCMVDSADRVSIGDFGLARDLHHNDYYRPDDLQRPLPFKWMAIESLEDRNFSSKSDVWSFGVFMWEIFSCGGLPYCHVETSFLSNYLRHGNRLERPVKCPPSLFALMIDCWNLDPDARPIFKDLVNDLQSLMSFKEGQPNLAAVSTEYLSMRKSMISKGNHTTEKGNVASKFNLPKGLKTGPLAIPTTIGTKTATARCYTNAAMVDDRGAESVNEIINFTKEAEEKLKKLTFPACVDIASPGDSSLALANSSTNLNVKDIPRIGSGMAGNPGSVPLKSIIPTDQAAGPSTTVHLNHDETEPNANEVSNSEEITPPLMGMNLMNQTGTDNVNTRFPAQDIHSGAILASPGTSRVTQDVTTRPCGTAPSLRRLTAIQNLRRSLQQEGGADVEMETWRRQVMGENNDGEEQRGILRSTPGRLSIKQKQTNGNLYVS